MEGRVRLLEPNPSRRIGERGGVLMLRSRSVNDIREMGSGYGQKGQRFEKTKDGAGGGRSAFKREVGLRNGGRLASGAC